MFKISLRVIELSGYCCSRAKTFITITEDKEDCPKQDKGFALGHSDIFYSHFWENILEVEKPVKSMV